MKTSSLFRWLFAAIPLGFPTLLPAQVPALLNCQGRVSIGGTNYDGTGAFQFALVNGTGTATFWSNGTSSVSLAVGKGLYSVLLGDTNVADMAALSASVFTNGDVRLRVSFAPQGQTPQLLSPDQRIASVGYAFTAGGMNDGKWSVRTGDVLDGEGQTHSNLLLFSEGTNWLVGFTPEGEVHARGNLSTEGDVYATGTIETDGRIESGSDLVVNGGGSWQIQLATNGTIWARGDLQLGGNANFDGSLDVEDETLLHSNLWIEGDAHVARQLEVEGEATFRSNLVVDGIIFGTLQGAGGKPTPTVEEAAHIVYGSMLNGTPIFSHSGFSVQTNLVVGSSGIVDYASGTLASNRLEIVLSHWTTPCFAPPRYIRYGGLIRVVSFYGDDGSNIVMRLACGAGDLEAGFSGSVELDPSVVNMYTVTFDTPFRDTPTVLVTYADNNSIGNAARPWFQYVKLRGPELFVSNNQFTVVHGVTMRDECSPLYPEGDITWQFMAIGPP